MTLESERKLSSRELKYLKMLREHNKENKTWRQFYTELYGECMWMNSTQYGGAWLDIRQTKYVNTKL